MPSFQDDGQQDGHQDGDGRDRIDEASHHQDQHVRQHQEHPLALRQAQDRRRSAPAPPAVVVSSQANTDAAVTMNSTEAVVSMVSNAALASRRSAMLR